MKNENPLMNDIARFQESARTIRERYPHPIHVAAILGSGLGCLADTLLPNAVRIPYSEIPFFPQSTVEGHEGVLCLGQLQTGVHVAFLQGRVHLYEGHPVSTTVYPVRVMRLLGAQMLLVTNSAGGVNPAFQPGDLMLITDHINLMGQNPLIGKNCDELGPRFPDMSEAYTAELRALAQQKAHDLGISLQQGVYCAGTGPCYETPAEVRMIRTLGGDAVGMSTVPEVIVASHMEMKVLGISCITNPAAGVLQGHRLSHQEVLDAADKARDNFAKLVQAVFLALPVPSSTPAA